jgi:hypothetical protein
MKGAVSRNRFGRPKAQSLPKRLKALALPKGKVQNGKTRKSTRRLESEHFAFLILHFRSLLAPGDGPGVVSLPPTTNKISNAHALPNRFAAFVFIVPV